MSVIKFNYQDEYIEELKKAKLELPIVRLTNLQRYEQSAPLRALAVVSTAKAANGDIIRLQHFCGTLWGIDSQDEEVWKRAEIIHTEIRDACKTLSLEVRAGVIEE